MPRILAVNVPGDKHIGIGLTHIFGIGRSRAKKVCAELGINFSTKGDQLTEGELNSIRELLKGYILEGDLRREKMLAIKRLMEMACYRGRRHRSGLPVRGQNTQKNARTRKGKKKLAKAKV
jgi:small subunit ribosomal protein S13